MSPLTIVPYSEYIGMVEGIELWNSEAKRVLAGLPHPFQTVDMFSLSDRLHALILRDCVHFKPPIYELQAVIDFNIIFRDVKFCF